MSSWTLKSIPPHDWTLCLDIDSCFDHEHDPQEIPRTGFTRPIPLPDRDIVITLFFNEDPEQPEFHVRTEEELSREEVKQASRVLKRMLGCELDLRPFYDQAASDPVLGPAMSELYGLKRMSRASLFEDILNRIIQMRLSHKPTARKMVYRVRERYGTHLMHSGNPLPAWPRPFQLAGAEPSQIRMLGPTLRKGEYIAGLAQSVLSGALDLEWLDRQASPAQFYDTIIGVRGIGPSLAQDLMLYRPVTDAVFPSHRQKGEERGLRRWIILRYGGDPAQTTEEEFPAMIENWKGFEAAGVEFLFLSWVLEERAKQKEKPE